MQIRQYTDDDLKAVISSWESASKMAHPFLEEDFLAQERINIAELYLPNAETWVAELDGKVIGFIALIGNEVGGIFLQPSYHGKGIGKALMDKAQELRGSLEVEVFTKNSIGRKFYSNYGFEKIEEKVHDKTGNDLLRLKFIAAK
ncbi:GNAT family N-acetyltransferase [Pleurocapsa sp. PCC 7319]|uniref:GNAT family N-acetyltransferase n=1 Tax=Pleurocapsa sp. PCC 7319 TaxID=118161 RepID=UPI00036DD25A|nr:GNAT family N-acetyltransferase [Pleurocapsa sp. PCC 7319]